MSNGYVNYHRLCENAPGWQQYALDGHTEIHFSYGNAAGFRWGINNAPHVCRKCGGELIGIKAFRALGKPPVIKPHKQTRQYKKRQALGLQGKLF